MAVARAPGAHSQPAPSSDGPPPMALQEPPVTTLPLEQRACSAVARTIS